MGLRKPVLKRKPNATSGRQVIWPFLASATWARCRSREVSSLPRICSGNRETLARSTSRQGTLVAGGIQRPIHEKFERFDGPAGYALGAVFRAPSIDRGFQFFPDTCAPGRLVDVLELPHMFDEFLRCGAQHDQRQVCRGKRAVKHRRR